MSYEEELEEESENEAETDGCGGYGYDYAPGSEVCDFCRVQANCANSSRSEDNHRKLVSSKETKDSTAIARTRNCLHDLFESSKEVI
jgi:hypothetical protein